jgi:hypothetical protein
VCRHTKGSQLYSLHAQRGHGDSYSGLVLSTSCAGTIYLYALWLAVKSIPLSLVVLCCGSPHAIAAPFSS